MSKKIYHKDYIVLSKEEGEQLRESRIVASLSTQEVTQTIRINRTTLLTLERKGGAISKEILGKLIKRYNSR